MMVSMMTLLVSANMFMIMAMHDDVDNYFCGSDCQNHDDVVVVDDDEDGDGDGDGDGGGDEGM